MAMLSVARLLILCYSFIGALCTSAGKLTPGFRPPAVPLIVQDPYTSYWSANDNLYDGYPQHWTGSEIGMVGMITIDQTTYRFMGGEDMGVATPTVTQKSVSVYPTQTVYVFEQDGVQLTLSFSTPAAIMDDTIEFIGLPVTFITFTVVSIDGKDHNVQIYYDNTAEGTVSDISSNVTFSRVSVMPGETGMRFGSQAQTFAEPKSDRINWGYWYVTTILDKETQTTIGYSSIVRQSFLSGLVFPTDITDTVLPCSNGKVKPVIAVRWDLGTVSTVSKLQYLRIFYEQEYAISYFGKQLKPLWKQMYGSFDRVFKQLDYQKNIDSCDNMDEKVTSALYAVGGSNYTTISSLAWRQAIGGLVAVWNDVKNSSWIFLKEISSGGDTSTVDVLFPASPLYLWANPEAMKKMLLPILDYANNQSVKYGLNIPYNLSWAPHHLGKYPVCDLEPMNQEQMPIEESGNMLMMIATIVKLQKGNVTFLEPYWDLLNTWSMYISVSLPDPGNQLCTDDFEGPSPHNTNLAVKGIVGLSSYLYLLEAKKNLSVYELQIIKLFKTLNQNFKSFWLDKGLANTTADHYTREFGGAPTSWSLKYNLLFQEILQLNDFGIDVVLREMDYYRKQMNNYGIPLDDRHPYTKTDWLMWVAALAQSTSADMFGEITDHVFKFANETPDRVPFTDWYDVSTGNKQGNFRARPVIGGLYAKLLTTAPTR